MKLYVFDMDGTLTPARKPMTEDFARWFRDFIGQNTVYIASGSDLSKIKLQVPADILDGVAGIYASMGNELYKQGRQIYKRNFRPEESLIKLLEEYRKNTKYNGSLFPNYIEPRCGMINFSILGRDCPFEERVKYKEWDDKHCERAEIQKYLEPLFPDLDITLGGNISLDIVPKGYGKEQVAVHLRQAYPEAEIIFVGDRTEKGGNDYSLAQKLLSMGNCKVFSVRGPEEIPLKLKTPVNA